MPIEFEGEVFLTLDEAKEYFEINLVDRLEEYFFHFKGFAEFQTVLSEKEEIRIDGMAQISAEIFKKIRNGVSVLYSVKPLPRADSYDHFARTPKRYCLGYDDFRFKYGMVNGTKAISEMLDTGKIKIPKGYDIKKSSFYVKKSSLKLIADQFGIKKNYKVVLRERTHEAESKAQKNKNEVLEKEIKRIKAENTRLKAADTLHKNWRKAFEYESEGLNAFYELIEKYFFNASNAPIYTPKGWPLKKNLESKWLKGRTLKEADKIITSGKRKGKAN